MAICLVYATMDSFYRVVSGYIIHTACFRNHSPVQEQKREAVAKKAATVCYLRVIA